MATTTTVEDVVRRALAGVGDDAGIPELELVDFEVRSNLVRVVLDRPGGVDIEALTLANRIVSAALDAQDPIPGRYTLEVSSPGLERPLRTPEHFARHVGSSVSVKTRAGVPGERRIRGELMAADGSGITLACGEGEPRRLSYGEIDKARTIFEWGSIRGLQSRPGSPSTNRSGAK
ncbi:MAG: ribosome maturation factor RimP [Acidimicrobiales bacterium]